MRLAHLLATTALAATCATAQAVSVALPPTANAQDSAPASTTAVHKVRGFLPDLRFTLRGAGNTTVTQDDFKGKAVMLFFGYASCPDICPTTMAQLAQVMHELGDDAAKVRILFISVDPHRDTPDKLQAYVDVFGKNAIGLTGSERQIADVARRYRVAYQIEKPKAGDTENYEVAHGRGVYIFDTAGRARLLASDSNSTEAITAGVRSLLR